MSTARVKEAFSGGSFGKKETLHSLIVGGREAYSFSSHPCLECCGDLVAIHV
jgi:hypothetical protein